MLANGVLTDHALRSASVTAELQLPWLHRYLTVILYCCLWLSAYLLSTTAPGSGVIQVPALKKYMSYVGPD